MVLGVQVVSDGGGNSEEVAHKGAVADVGVKVVLEVLKHVHVLLHELIPSNSWEGEGLVVEFPSVDLESLLVGVVLTKGLVNVKSVLPVSWVKGS